MAEFSGGGGIAIFTNVVLEYWPCDSRNFLDWNYALWDAAQVARGQ